MNFKAILRLFLHFIAPEEILQLYSDSICAKIGK